MKPKRGLHVWLRIPRTPATEAAGLLQAHGTRVRLQRRFTKLPLTTECWVVDPPLLTVLQQPCIAANGLALSPGHRLFMRAVPLTWMRERPDGWTEAESAFLREHYGTWVARDIAAHLGRGVDSIRAQVQKLGIAGVGTRWTPELDEFLALQFPDTAATDLAEVMGATAAAIRRRAAQLGVRKDAGFASRNATATVRARSRFTPEIEEVIQLLYPDTQTHAIADLVGMPVERVHAFANARGWRKDRDFVRAAARARGLPEAARARQFKKGLVPWNTGRKGITYPGMERTQFPKGHRPQTWKPVGSYRINADGYLDRKVTDEGRACDRWQPVHRIVWIEANGPVPAGKLVRFKPGMKTTKVEEITVDRLECVTLAENMARNSFHNNYPPEIAALIITKGHLQRQINKRERLQKEAQS